METLEAPKVDFKVVNFQVKRKFGESLYYTKNLFHYYIKRPNGLNVKHYVKITP